MYEDFILRILFDMRHEKELIFYNINSMKRLYPMLLLLKFNEIILALRSSLWFCLIAFSIQFKIAYFIIRCTDARKKIESH